MATANFYTQKNFDLYAGDFTIPLYPLDEDGNEIEDAEPFDYWTDEYLLELVQDKIDEVNEKLKFYQLELRNGYYEGTQIFIREGDETPDEFAIKNYFSFDWYGVNRYILRRMINAEKKLINNKILPLFKEYGFDKYFVVARFSSGETWYEKAE